jgi:hypothetical protein
MDPVTLGLAAAVAVGGLLLIVIFVALRKGRPLGGEHVFRASRWSRGNRLFPTQVMITPQSVTHYTPQWIGKLEKSIHMAHVASINIDTNLLFSDVVIETTGGHQPVRCHGHTRGDAVKMKQLIEQFQSEYYKGGAAAAQPQMPMA